ncbi:hypothetical protein B296_00009627 [Ensete ventricosum]|uniref:ELMO domain-containing protein n=1 Tax=Ensete ventricosum TaxID=4639 RepID=A0A426ZB86_ENSVE|nr:hypothetical protein B296_00009627 [Ensete ventricosum]
MCRYAWYSSVRTIPTTDRYAGKSLYIVLIEEGRRAEWEYPFAVAGVNVSFMLIQMLDLQSGRSWTAIWEPNA